MNRNWLMGILGLSFTLLALLKTHEVNSLSPYFKSEPFLKLQNFSKARALVNGEQRELLELWESILTGRSAPLSSLTRKTYQDLGLKHVFTPSGFHLTAVLAPFLRLSSSFKFQIGLLSLLGILLSFIPGMGALKRMVLIKGSQKLTGMKFGFVLALLIDVLVGTFQDTPVSFCYSFLFLGIIYSGLRGIGLIFWFFIGQLLICHFQAVLISPLLLLWSPLLNLVFALAMPLLLVLAIPLWDWQLHTGLFLLELIHKLIMLASYTLTWFPMWEISVGILVAVLCFVFRKKRLLWIVVLLLSNSLNLDLEKIPGPSTQEFRPRGNLMMVKKDVAYFSDGKCRFKLIKGQIWEKCRQKKAPPGGGALKKLKKL